MSELELGASDNGRHLTLRVGDTVVVRLNENPTTGYRWAVAAPSSILPVESTFDAPQEAAIGAGGERTFRFTAEGAGTADLVLKLYREWEGEGSSIEQFEVSTQVTD